MTHQEFRQYVGSLPPEVQGAIGDALAPLGDYAARAAEVRAHLSEKFPKLQPPLRAVLSLALARYR